MTSTTALHACSCRGIPGVSALPAWGAGRRQDGGGHVGRVGGAVEEDADLAAQLEEKLQSVTQGRIGDTKTAVSSGQPGSGAASSIDELRARHEAELDDLKDRLAARAQANANWAEILYAGASKVRAY